MTTHETSPAHTPGPFQVFVSPGDQLYLAQVDENGSQVRHLCSLTRDDQPGENAANARLFAAAPDLLRACEYTIDLLDHLSSREYATGGDRPAREELIASVAKAKGEWAEPRLAEDRDRAALRASLARYFSLRPEDRIRLAMDILHDIDNDWDHDGLVHYPKELPSFDEYLADIGGKLYAIRWK